MSLQTHAKIHRAIRDHLMRSGTIPLHALLALPNELLKHRIHPTFHSWLLRPAILNDDAQFPNCKATFFYDFGDNPEQEWQVDSIINHMFTGNSITFDILWEMGKMTHEPLKNCKDLAALDRYLELHGIPGWQALPCQ